jgi:hypothetical protein
MHTLMPKWHVAVVDPLAKLLADDLKNKGPTPNLADHSESEVEEQGRALVGSKSLGCIKCHSFVGDKGQSLGVIDMARMPTRLRHDWFLAYVANPQQFRPGTRMPASWPEGKTFYPDVLDGTASGQIEAVWRYLRGTKPPPPVGVSGNPIELVPTDSVDGRRVRLALGNLREDVIHELKMGGIRNAAGLPLLHDTGWYTLNRLSR